MVRFYNWVGFSLLFMLSCGNPININTPKVTDVEVTKARFDDQLIVEGKRFNNIKAVSLSDPKTGQIIKKFKVVRYDDDEIIGEQLDYNKIPIPNLLNLLIDTAQGQSVIPVQFSINANSVYTGAIQNGAITPTKFKGITANPTIPSVLSYNPATDNFFFATPSGGGGGGSGVDEIYRGDGIVGDGSIATGTVDITVNVGETGNSTLTFIPYFSNDNAIVLDSLVNANTRLLFDDGSEQVSLSFYNGLFRINDESVTLPAQGGDLLTIEASNGRVDILGELYVASQTVCLANGTGCPTGIQPITGVPPIIVSLSEISADTGTAPGQLVQLEAPVGTATVGSLPAVDGSKLLNNVTKVIALDGITVSNGGIGQVEIGLAPAGSTGSAQPWDPALEDISNITYPPVDGEMIIGASGTYVGQSGATLRASMGLAIGSDVQAWDQDLETIAGFAPTQGQYIIANAAGDWTLGNTGVCGPGYVMTGLGPTISCSDNSFIFKNRETQWYETSANGTNYLAFTAPAALVGTTIWTLPDGDGVAGTVLTTDGLGQLSWGTGNGDVRGPASAIIGQVAVFSTTTGKNITNAPLLVTDIVARTTTPVIGGHLPEYNGTTGSSIQDSGIVAANVVTNAGASPIGNLPSFTGTGKAVQDSTIPAANVVTMIAPGTGNYILGSALGLKTATESNILITNVPTMAANATGTYQPILSAANNTKTLISASYSIPAGVCPNGQILKSDGNNFICGTDTDTPPPVLSVFTRTGAVTAQAGDYTATLITSLPTGGVSATTVQGAITELDAEKLALVGGDMTGTIRSAAPIALQVGPYGAAAGNTGEIHYLELAGNGIQYVGFKAPDSINTNVIWTLPDVIGNNGQVLTTVGGGILSWTLPGSAGVGDVVGPTSSTDNAIARFDLTTGKLIQNSVVTISDTGDLFGISAFNSTGNFTVTGNGSFTGDLSARSYTNNSDRSLKKDIKPFTGASSIVDKLMPVTFRWKNDDDKQVIGLIAQDLEKVVPEVVSKSNQKGNIVRSYDLGQVLILTLEALKETREELKQTQNELKIIREKVKELEKSKI